MKVLLVAGLVGAVFLPMASSLHGGEDAEASRDARKRLGKAIDARSNDQVKACLQELVIAGGKENIDAVLRILPKVPETEDAIYWDLIQGACSFRDKEALEFLGEAILQYRSGPLARDLIYGLARNGSPKAALALEPVLSKGAPDLQLMAAVKLGTILAPEAVDALVQALKREEGKDSELKDAIIDGLRTITGQGFTSSVNWEGWWKQNRDKPLLGPNASKDGRATGTVVDDLDARRKKGFQGLEQAPKTSVIVLSAEFPERDLNNDHIEQILQSMGVPHEVVKRPDFEKFNLRGVGAIIINCAQFHEFCICPDCKPGGDKHNRLFQCTGCNKHIKFSGKLSAAAIKKIQGFVERGGYLFLEDWTVKEVLERAFPQYVSAGAVLKKDTVDVVPARGRASHPFLKGVFRPEKPPEREAEGDETDKEGKDGEGKRGKGPTTAVKPEEETPEKPDLVVVKHQWVVDDESWALKVQDSSKVVVLLTSGKLQKQAGGDGVAALYFRPGGKASSAVPATGRRSGPGLVMQVLSHFGKQESSEDEYTLQNILLNFLISANVNRNAAEAPAKAKAVKGKKAKDGDKDGEKDGEKDDGEEGKDSGAEGT